MFSKIKRFTFTEWFHHKGGGRSSRLVRPFEKNLNLTIIGPTRTVKLQGFDHKYQDFWSDQGWSGRTGSSGPASTK